LNTEFGILDTLLALRSLAAHNFERRAVVPIPRVDGMGCLPGRSLNPCLPPLYSTRRIAMIQADKVVFTKYTGGGSGPLNLYLRKNMSTDNLDGKVAVITGAAGGFGAVLVRGMLAQGAQSGRARCE
jgi:hypothetical protein